MTTISIADGVLVSLDNGSWVHRVSVEATGLCCYRIHFSISAMTNASRLIVLAALWSVSVAHAEEEPAAVQPSPGEPAADDVAEPPPFDAQPGPIQGKIGDVATVDVPDGFAFVEASQMSKLNAATGNLHNPNDLGAILSPDGSIVFFTWEGVGYVKDDDKEKLDADELMQSFKDAEGPSNEARKEKGYPAIFIEGWAKKPYYDQSSNHLTWALRNRSEGDGERSVGINHNVRLLGRRGVMSAVLVASPEKLEAATQRLNGMLQNFRFNEGQRYAEYVQGDKIAEYGLAGLVLGGGLVAAGKMGLLAKLGKFIKVIAVAVLAAVGGLYRWITGRKQAA